MKFVLQFTLRALCALLASGGLLVSTSRAGESSDLQESEPLSISDLDPDSRIAVSNLAISLAASSANADAATVEDNVSAILALLQSVRQQNITTYLLRTFPNFPGRTGPVSFAPLLNRSLYENSTTPIAESAIKNEDSYLYEIQRALYGKRGYPTENESLLPVLWRIESALTNNQSSVDMSWTNLLQSQSFFLSDLLSQDSQIANNIAEYFNSVNVGTDSQWGRFVYGLWSEADIIQDVYEEEAHNASTTDSALRVADANVLRALWQMDQTLQGIGYDVQHIQFPTEIAITNFDPLIAWMRTNLLATVDDEYQASHAVSEIVSDAEYNKVQAESAVEEFDTSPLPTNGIPSFAGDVLNPWNPLLSEAVGLKSKIENKLPDFDETGGDTIVILDGTSDRAEIRNIGRWTVNVREELQPFVNEYGFLIDWFWRLFNSLTALGAILSVWHKVHSSM